MWSMSAYDVMSANQNVHKQTFTNHSNVKTSWKCIEVIIKVCDVRKIYTAQRLSLRVWLTTVRRNIYTLHKLLRYVNYKLQA